MDLYIVRVDPQNPTRYIVGEKTLEMDIEETVIGLPEGESVRKTVYRTIYGPVITELEQGVEGAVALRWYGTLPEAEITDRTIRSVLSFLDAKSVKDIMEGVCEMKIMGFNFVIGDTDGNIGWHTTGDDYSYLQKFYLFDIEKGPEKTNKRSRQHHRGNSSGSVFDICKLLSISPIHCC